MLSSLGHLSVPGFQGCDLPILWYPENERANEIWYHMIPIRPASVIRQLTSWLWVETLCPHFFALLLKSIKRPDFHFFQALPNSVVAISGAEEFMESQGSWSSAILRLRYGCQLWAWVPLVGKPHGDHGEEASGHMSLLMIPVLDHNTTHPTN